MEIEELRVICEHMGWSTQTFNDSDCIAIMCKLGISIQVDSGGDGYYVTVWDTDINIYEMFSDINDEDRPAMVRRLICKAAYEYLKEK